MMLTGYVEKEMKKDGIKVTETGDNPKAPFPREMVDLEVTAVLFSA